MENIGLIIKQIREDKGISPKEVYTGIMDRTNYWRFENGMIESYFVNVFQIINRLNITFEEFMFLIEEENLKEEQQEKEEFIKLWGNSDITGLEKLKNKANHLYRETGQIKYLLREMNLVVYINMLMDRPYNKTAVKKIKNYLFKVENWHTFELDLLGNSLFIFDIDTAMLLYRKSLKSFRRFSLLQKTGDEELQLTINLLHRAIIANECLYIRELRKNIKGFEPRIYSAYSKILKKWSLLISKAYLNNETALIAEARNFISLLKQAQLNSTAQICETMTNEIESQIKGKIEVLNS